MSEIISANRVFWRNNVIWSHQPGHLSPSLSSLFWSSNHKHLDFQKNHDTNLNNEEVEDQVNWGNTWKENNEEENKDVYKEEQVVELENTTETKITMVWVHGGIITIGTEIFYWYLQKFMEVKIKSNSCLVKRWILVDEGFFTNVINTTKP